MNKKMFIPVCLGLLSLSLAACKVVVPSTDVTESNPPTTHTHTWAETWESDGTNHWHACTDSSCNEVNGKVAHSGGTATCQGKAKCSVCEAEYGELAGHSYSENWTCSDEGHYKECTTEGCDAKTETTAHSGGTATCKAKGTCSECGEAYGEFAAHTWAEVVNADFLASKATCTAKATYYKSCAVCGDTSTETFEGGDLAAHKGGTATCSTKAVCEVCEQPYGDLVAHTPGAAATQSEPQVCTKCGYIIAPALGHTEANPKAEWSADDTYHWHDCQGCNEHITDKGEHTGGTATTTSKAVCTVCQKEYGEKLEILPCDNYTIKVNGVENTEAAVTPTGEDYAQFTANLLVNDVVTITGDGTLLTFPALENATQFTATVEGAHTFYVNKENNVYVVAPTTGGGDSDGLVLYLVPNSNWTADNARFAAYFFGNGETWVSMTDSNSDGIYEVAAPTGYPSVIFCRMNPGASENNWDNKWSQTADLVVPNDDNVKYTIKPAAWETGAWSKLNEEPVFEEVTVEYYLRGTVNDWAANPSDEYLLTAQGEEFFITIALEANDELKFTLSKSWDTSYGYANVDAGCKNLVSEIGWGNIKITTAGTYTFYIKPNEEDGKKIWINKEQAEHTHVKSETWTVEGNNHWKTCSGCDEKLDLGTHEGGTATCTAKAVCTVCNTAYGELAQHTPEVVEAVAPKCEETGLTEGSRCSVCEEVLVAQEEVAVLGHKGGTATCTAKAVCTVCNNPYGELADHQYGELQAGTANSCEDTGTLSYYQCSVCEKYFTENKVETTWENLQVVAAGHTYGELVEAKEASCMEDGYLAYYQCSVCKKYFNEAKEEKTLEELTVTADHTYGELVKAKEATCAEKGHAAYYQCSVCEKYFTEAKVETTLEALAIEASSHSWDYTSLTVTTLPTAEADGVAQLSCEKCAEKHNVVLPREADYVREFYTENEYAKAGFVISVAPTSVATVVAANADLDEQKLTEAVGNFNEKVAPSVFGLTYLVTLDDEFVSDAVVELNAGDNKAVITLEIQKGKTLRVYNNTELVSFVHTEWGVVFEGSEYVVPATGTQIFYISKDGGIYGGFTPIVFDNYSIKVNNTVVEDVAVEAGSGYNAQFEVALSVAEVLEVYGDDELLGTYTCEASGNYIVYVSGTNSVSVLSAEVELETVTLYYYNNLGWDEVACHAWTDAGANFTGGSWPGTTDLTLDGNWYSITISAESLSGLKVIFNNNNKGSQTGNITVDFENVYYYGSGTTGYANKEAVEELVATSPVASNVYLAGSMNGWSTSSTPLYVTSNSDIVELIIELSAGSYEFKFVVSGTWKGNGGTISDTTDPYWWDLTSGSNIKLTATGGTYKFEYRLSDNHFFVTKVS